jgi:opacity protein-like surface antigen
MKSVVNILLIGLVGAFCPIALSAPPVNNQPQKTEAANQSKTDSSYWPSLKKVYISGIVGASFANTSTSGNSDTTSFYPANYNGSINGQTFTGGSALGLKLGNPAYLTRLEIEARGRTSSNGSAPWTIHNPFLGDLNIQGTGQVSCMWSAMTNIWQDFRIGKGFSVYSGGGIGAGGYNYKANNNALNLGDNTVTLSGSNSITQFAWQVGAGVAYDFTKHFTMDLSYRYFALLSGSTPINFYNTTDTTVNNIHYGTADTTFSTNELLVTFRLVDPLGLF